MHKVFKNKAQRCSTPLRPLKLDFVFSATFLSAHNEATFSLFIIHYFYHFRSTPISALSHVHKRPKPHLTVIYNA